MRLLKVMLFISGCALLMPLSSHAKDDFYGTIESTPEGKMGTWVIGGRQVAVTEKTQLDEDHGFLAVGACAEVEYEGGLVDEIESENKLKCEK